LGLPVPRELLAVQDQPGLRDPPEHLDRLDLLASPDRQEPLLGLLVPWVRQVPQELLGQQVVALDPLDRQVDLDLQEQRVQRAELDLPACKGTRVQREPLAQQVQEDLQELPDPPVLVVRQVPQVQRQQLVHADQPDQPAWPDLRVRLEILEQRQQPVQQVHQDPPVVARRVLRERRVRLDQDPRVLLVQQVQQVVLDQQVFLQPALQGLQEPLEFAAQLVQLEQVQLDPQVDQEAPEVLGQLDLPVLVDLRDRLDLLVEQEPREQPVRNPEICLQPIRLRTRRLSTLRMP